jgi:quercetin dioxygenase-like cupin family protein
MTYPELITLASAAQTGGDHVAVEALFPPGAPASPERLLAGHEVRIEVLEGRLELIVNGARRPLRAGEALTVAPGVPHRLSVAAANGPARFIWRIRPAPADERELERIFGLIPASGNEN